MRKYIIPVGLLSVLLLFLSESCSLFQGRDEVIIGTEKTDTCRSNPEHTYEVYIPDIRNRCSEMPVLIIIDPHGNGKYALELFKAGADQHEFALFASNLLRNNYTEYIDGLNDLIEDIKGKYPVADKIYLAGFSGGGRMILNYARYFPAEGLIVSGALASAEELTAVKSPVFAIIGMDDFNFIEVAQYIFKPEAAPQNLRIEFTQASHSWPKPSLLSDALGYLELSVIKGSKCSEMKAQQKEYCHRQAERVDSLSGKDEYLMAGLIARNMIFCDEFSRHFDFHSLHERIEYSSAFNAELEQLKESIRFELTVRHAYYDALQSEDTLWWRNEINSLEAKISSERDLYRNMAYRRIKGFLGIMCYSLSNQIMQEKGAGSLVNILSIYKMLEPENPDMFYFSALVARQKGDIKKARSILQQAHQAGFNDLKRMTKEVPELVDFYNHLE